MFRTFVNLLVLFTSVCNAEFDINDKKCLRSTWTQGYRYYDFYNITDTTDATDNENHSSVMLRFYVQAASNAHVMLTAEPSSFGYEIVLGGGSNSFSEIRKSSRTKSVITLNNRILDANSVVGFWIRVTQETGIIEVGKVGETLPFMFWMDSKPIPVKYFAFSAWDGVVCKWFYKCHPITASAENTDKVDKFLTYTERLKKEVLKNRGAFGAGNPPLNAEKKLIVEISSDFKFVHLDIMTSTLTLQGYATFEWIDSRISWDPKNYKNISKLHLSNYELWRPELVLHNALEPASSMFSESKISVDNNGKVMWRPVFSTKTKCDVDLKSWPWDRHKCSLLLSTWSHKISDIFYVIKDTNRRSECFQMDHSDWKLDNMTSFYTDDNTPWDDVIASINGDYSADEQNSLQINIELSRNTKVFEKLFYGPLILISFLWLSSFFVMPDACSKITTICVSIVFLTLTITYMTSYVPIFDKCPPNLLIVYLKMMLLMSTDALVSSCLVSVRNSARAGHPPFALTRFLTTPVVARVLALPKLEPRRTAATSSGNTTLWDIVVVALERIVFVAYSAVALAVVSSASS